MKILLSVLLFSGSLQAAVQKSNLGEQIIHSLRKPHTNAVEDMKILGPEGFKELSKIAFDEKYPMNTRWKAVMVLTKARGKQNIGLLKKAIQSQTWYMRSAGLTALQSLDPMAAKKWAYQKLDKDPALMVRMKAFEILKNAKGEEVTELFWKKLHSSDSFHRKEGLWIREDLVRELSQRVRSQDKNRWVRVLHEKDEKLQLLASRALAVLHNKNPEEVGKRVGYWRDRYPAQSGTL